MRACLVSMPFGMVFSPSIALGLLKQIALGKGWDVDVRYFNLEFARLVDARFYNDIAARLPTHSLVGEWVFSSCFGERPAESEAGFIDAIVRPLFADPGRTILRRPVDVEDFVAALHRAREAAPAFVRSCAAVIADTEPDLVGITSVFQQHAASIALSREIKALDDGITVVMGGANCEGPMGRALTKVAPWIDAVVSGEGEQAFATLLDERAAAGARSSAAGAFPTRFLPAGAQPRPSTGAELDALPVPDYDDYFQQLREAGLDTSFFRVEIPVETARGCWWGEKHHCTFCGLNGGSMAYRSKSPERAYAELTALIRRHPGCRIAMTDNILDMKYLRTLLPRLADDGIEMEAFWEVKANLSRQQLDVIRGAGVTHIQPGVESLSDSVLTRMRKGVRAIQNVQLLVDCASTGIVPGWNILWGFPGEEADEYRRIADLLPALFHLHPPVGAGPVGIHRFSPLFEQSEALGVGRKWPAPAYRFAFPFAGDDLDDLAYFFDGEYALSSGVSAYTARLRETVDRWKAEHEQSALASVDLDGALIVIDTRSCRLAPVTILRDREREVFLGLSRATTREACLAAVTADLREATGAIVDGLVRRRLVVEIGRWLLALAVPIDEECQPAGKAAEAIVAALRGSGREDQASGTLHIEAERVMA